MRCGAVFRPAVETGTGAAGVLEFTVCDEVGLGVAEGAVAANDIVRVQLALQAPLYVDRYEAVRATGAFILIDEATNDTVAAGMVVHASSG